MSFLSGLVQNIENFFGGGNNDAQKKKQQQQQQQNQPQPQRSAGPTQLQNNPLAPPVNNQNNPAAPPPLDLLHLTSLNPNALQKAVPGAPAQPGPGQPVVPPAAASPAPAPAQPTVAQRLATATDANQPAALKQVQQNEGLLGKVSNFFTGNDQKIANQQARNKAVSDFQASNGYNQNPDVQKFLGDTINSGNDLSASINNQGKSLQKVANVTNTVGKVAQYVPITGSVLNLGLKAADMAGNTDATAARDNLDFGMTPEQLAALPQDQQNKLETVRNIGLAASPLDFLGAGGLVKSEGVAVAKKAALQAIKTGAIDDVTKQALKTTGVDTLKKVAVAGGAGAGISAAAQDYLTGKVDPLEAAKGGLTAAGTSLLIPGGGGKKAAAESATQDAETAAKTAEAGANEVSPGISKTAANAAQDVPAAAPVERGPRPLIDQPSKFAPDDGTPAFLRKVQQPAAADPNVPDPSDIPAFQHKQNIQNVIDQGNSELNDFVNQHQDATPAEIQQAKDSITQQVTDRVTKLQNDRAAAVTGEQPAGPQISAEHPDAPKIIKDNAPEPAEPAPAPVEPLPIDPKAMNDHENAVLSQLNDKAKNAVLTPEEKTTHTALQAKQDSIQTANAPAEVPKSEPAAAPAAPADTTKVDDKLNEVGQALDASSRTAANAPGIRGAVQKTAKKLGLQSTLDSESTEHSVLGNEELTSAAKDAISNRTDQQVINDYKQGASFHGAADVARGNAAIDKLNEILGKDPTNKDAQQALDNVMSAAEKEISSGGRTISYAKEFYNNLKGPAKVSYIMRQIDKAREDAGLPKIGPNVDEASRINANLTHYLGNDENLQSQISKLESQASDNLDAAKSGAATKETTAAGKDIQTQLNQLKLRASENTSELAKFINSPEVLPSSQTTSSKIGNFTRSLMLSSPTGRMNDVITTGFNAAHTLLVDNASAAAGKGVNLLRKVAGKDASGNLDSTFTSPAALIKGLQQGRQMSKARFAGKLTDANPNTLIKNGVDNVGKGNLSSTSGKGIPGFINQKVRAATEIATDLSESVKNASIQTQATNEGKRLGLTGENLKAYTTNRTAAPSKDMQEVGENLKQTVNNMQDNPISTALGKRSQELAKIPVVGETLRNIMAPFTRWTGGQLWNSAVNNNVAVSFGRAINAARKGDPQEAFNQAARTGINTAAVGTLGYQLAASGMISHTNAEGYNDDGSYLKIGGHYIPLGFTGFFAPGLILGSSTYEAMNDPKNKTGNAGQDLANRIVDTAFNTAKNTALSAGAASLTGEKNQVLNTYKNTKGNIGDTAAVAGSQVAGQYIPAGFNDVNAVINNGVGIPGTDIRIPGSDALNPNHEAAQTKATNPNSKSGTAKDYVQTGLNQLQNKIPFASQSLPRKAGIGAPDLIDRVDRGDHDTAGTIQTRADAATKLSTQQTLDKRISDNAKAGIPDPLASKSTDKKAHYQSGDTFEKAVENRIENGKFDQAQKGLELKLQDVQSGKDVTTKETAPIQKQIGVVKTLKEGNYDPSIRKDYSSTTVAQWRQMGNPKSASYDPDQYQLLYQYDSDLAKNGGSDAKNNPNGNKFTAKAVGSGSGSSSKAANAAANLIKSNTIGSPIALAKFTGTLSPQKIATVMPQIQSIPSGSLIKKRTISVTPTK